MQQQPQADGPGHPRLRQHVFGPAPPLRANYSVGGSPSFQYGGWWHFGLLPFVEQDAVYKAGVNYCMANANNNSFSAPISSGTIQNMKLTLFGCPSDSTLVNGVASTNQGWAGTSYAPNASMFGTSNSNGSRVSQYNIGNIPDGTSNTMAATEVWAGCLSGTNGYARLWTVTWDDQSWNPEVGFTGGDGTWSQPPQFGITPSQGFCDRARSQAIHSGTVNALLMDGSVRGISASVSTGTWQLALNPADGQVMGSDW